MLPNFLIVGAPKAGTTALYTWLRQHPDVFMPEHKEPSFFLNSGVRITDEQRYASLFDAVDGQRAVGEASTAYLASPESPELIRAHLGSRAKILILLREPAARAFSHYRWNVMAGFEWLHPFEKALKEEDARFRNPWFRSKNPEYFWDFMYFRTGLYSEQVQRYRKCFGSDNVKVVVFETMVSDPREVYADVCRFLGVTETIEPEITVENAGRFPRSAKMQFAISEVERLALVHRRKRARVRRWAKAMRRLNVKAGYRGRMAPATARELREAYREDVQRTAELSGLDLSVWEGYGIGDQAPSGGRGPVAGKSKQGATL